MDFKIFFSNFASVFNINKRFNKTTFVLKIYGILVLTMMLCLSCQWQLKPNDDDVAANVSIARYDRIESLYLTTGDYSALQQMNTYFPMQTRTLIEDVLHIGKVDDPETNSRLFRFFQDSTLQRMLTDVQQQYADMDDVNEELASAFERLQSEMPVLEIPQIYAQIGSFDQSIIVTDGALGISLDKYLGADYPFYLKNPIDYYPLIEQVTNYVIDVELPQLRKVNPSNCRKVKALLNVLAQQVPFDVDDVAKAMKKDAIPFK